MSLPRNVLVWVCALGLLSIGALWAWIAYDVQDARRALLRQAESQTLSVATALREHVHGVISNVDLILQRLGDDYVRSSGPYALPGWISQSRFVQKALLLVSIIGPDGRTSASSDPDLNAF